jgi:hypothetical protein
MHKSRASSSASDCVFLAISLKRFSAKSTTALKVDITASPNLGQSLSTLFSILLLSLDSLLLLLLDS